MVVAGKTEPLSVFLGASTTTAQGIGGIIATMGGFSSASGSASKTYVQVGGTGAANGSYVQASGGERVRGGWAVGLGVGVGVMVLVVL